MILKALNEKGYNLSEKDYFQIYHQIVRKQFLKQINDIKLSDGRTVKAEDFKSAYKVSENAIMEDSDYTYNEVNLYTPQIKGVVLIGKTMEDLSFNPPLLKYIREHDLPIFIIEKY